MQRINVEKIKRWQDPQTVKGRAGWFRNSAGNIILAIKEMDSYASIEKHDIDIEGNVNPSVKVTTHRQGEKIEFHEYIMLEDWDCDCPCGCGGEVREHNDHKIDAGNDLNLKNDLKF